MLLFFYSHTPSPRTCCKTHYSFVVTKRAKLTTYKIIIMVLRTPKNKQDESAKKWARRGSPGDAKPWQRSHRIALWLPGAQRPLLPDGPWPEGGGGGRGLWERVSCFLVHAGPVLGQKWSNSRSRSCLAAFQAVERSGGPVGCWGARPGSGLPGQHDQALWGPRFPLSSQQISMVRGEKVEAKSGRVEVTAELKGLERPPVEGKGLPPAPAWL